jgi:RHS repeat-associated protein
VRLVAALSLVLGVLVPVAWSSSVSGAATPGTGGVFTPATGRLMDTRNGTGGYSTPMPAGVWRSVVTLGQAGVPSSGVSAVVLNVTALGFTASGYVRGVPGGSTPPSSSATLLNFSTADASNALSNSAIIAPGPDGKIQFYSSTTTDLVVDVEGYFTAGDGSPSSGGFVPLTAIELAWSAEFTYDPWGNLTHHAGAQADNIKYRYAGGYLDTTTGLYKLGARYYNPTTGRFNQPDPAQLTGGYTYASDNPVNNTDPTGRSVWGDVFGTVFAVAAVAVTVAAVALVPEAFAAGFVLGLAAVGAVGPPGVGLAYASYYSYTEA